MNTDFDFLQELERDLTQAAQREKARMAGTAKPRRRSHRRAWIGAVASVLIVAFAIGFLAQGGGFRSPSMSSAGGSFSSVGSAVDEAGADRPIPAPRGAGNFSPALPGYDATRSSGGDPNRPQTGDTDLSKIVRDGAIASTIADGSFRDRYKQVFAIAAANEGSVLSSTTAGGDSGTFTLRVPATHFDKTMVQLGELGTVDSSEVHGDDVTAEYIDSKAHLHIYLSRRTVLYGLMGQADTLGETLTVQNHLEQVQLKIDQISGQLRFLNNQVAVSTIKVDLHEPDAAVPNADDIRNPSLPRAIDRAIQGFMNVLAAVLIGLGYLIPLGVIVGAGYLVVALVRRRARGRDAAVSQS